MLSIPFKKTDASIDLGGPLRRYLMKEFSTVRFVYLGVGLQKRRNRLRWSFGFRLAFFFLAWAARATPFTGGGWWWWAWGGGGGGEVGGLFPLRTRRES